MPLLSPLRLVLAALTVAGLLATSLAHAELPQTFKNVYSTRVFGIKITVTHQLTEREEGGQQIRFEADSWIGNVREISRFRWLDGVIQPHLYRYHRQGLGKNRRAELIFDWEKQKVSNDVQDKRWSMDIHEGVQDKLSAQLQLQKDLIDGKEQFVYPIADGGELKEYQFEVVGRERLNTSLGEVDTVKVQRRRKDDDRATNAWLAPEWDYLLVQLEQREDGDSHILTIDSARIDGQTIESF